MKRALNRSTDGPGRDAALGGADWHGVLRRELVYILAVKSVALVLLWLICTEAVPPIDSKATSRHFALIMPEEHHE